MARTIVAAIILLLLCGCSEDEVRPPENYFVEYQIGVDRIETPTSIGSTDSLVVKLYGTIGANTSYGFDHMETVETDSLFDLTAFGIHDTTPSLQVLSVLIEWRGQGFVKLPPHAGPVRVVFHQPDGSVVEETVAVGP